MAAQGPLTRAVAAALKVAPLQPQDAAGKALVRRYAVAIDGDPTPELLADLGPKLLAALTALGLTPAGRGVKGGAASVSPVARKLDEFTARRARKHSS